MTNRELVEKTLNFQPVPHPPFMILAGHAWICRRNGLSPMGLLRLPDAGAQISVDAYREAGSAVMFGGNQLGFYPITAMGGEVNNEIVGGAPEITRRPLSEPEDIEKFDLDKVIADMRASEWYQLCIKQTKNMRAIVGDETFIAVGAYGPFTYASQMIGVDKFMENLLDDEEGHIQKMIRFAAEIIFAFNKDMLAAGGDIVMTAEPVASGDLISQGMFEDFVLPINRELLERTKALCPYSVVHICGNTSVRVASMAESGFSGFSVDSIDMVAARQAAQGKMALLGNLNPAAVVRGLDKESVYQKSLELCNAMKDQSGFILAPGCDLPPDTPMENLQAMAKAAADCV